MDVTCTSQLTSIARALAKEGQAATRYGRRGRSCFVFLGKFIFGKRGKLARQRRKEDKTATDSSSKQFAEQREARAAKRGRGLGAK